MGTVNKNNGKIKGKIMKVGDSHLFFVFFVFLEV